MTRAFDAATKAIEDAGWDWLVRSNTAKPVQVGGKYFANVTLGHAVTSSGMNNPGFRSFPAWGNTPTEALTNAFKQMKAEKPQ